MDGLIIKNMAGYRTLILWLGLGCLVAAIVLGALTLSAAVKSRNGVTSKFNTATAPVQGDQDAAEDVVMKARAVIILLIIGFVLTLMGFPFLGGAVTYTALTM